ncbi:MAG: FG-GAP repeat protein [Deltaproteobacteria bacterium]|nr:FG-GAP repeat protein [Deltaproteobacteria bacterium]MBW2535793.1 FG-GAP repeat protein [Deltaproteobacteria bacterium]
MLVEAAKLTASDAAAQDRFGISVGISRDYAAVASGWHSTNPNGAVYLFERNDSGHWMELQKLTGSDQAPADALRPLAISGRYVVVGATQDDDNGIDSGAAYVFERDRAGSWFERQKLTASDGTAENYFGCAVSISGDRIIVGALSNDAGMRSGAAYVFEREAAGDWFEHSKLTASDSVQHSYFASAASISGDFALVAANVHNSDGTGGGRAYVFERDAGGQWTERQRLTASDGYVLQQFGRSVGISGSYAVIGAANDHNGTKEGSAYVFERSATGEWLEYAKLTAAGGGPNQKFGTAVAISGARLAVGAPGDLVNFESIAATYTYWRDPGGTWRETQELTALDTLSMSWFGQSVSISGDRVLVGAPQDWDDVHGAHEIGSAFVFEEACLGLPDGSACDDGIYCNGIETCNGGKCGSSTGDPCPGPDEDDDCSESCDEAARDCSAADHDGSSCPDGACHTGVCEPLGADGSADDGGSSCTTPGRRPSPCASALAALGLGLTVIRRRRSSTRPPRR